MFLSETFLFIFSMIITGLLAFIYVYFIITLSDLECDYINAQQCCDRLNMWMMPILSGQGFVNIFFLLHGHFWLFLFNLPITAWSAYELIKVPSGNLGVFDPTEIYNRGQLKTHMRDVLIKIAFFLVAFFVYLYSMIVSMLTAGQPVQAMGSPPSEFDEF
ncbi:unnamed protein product [Orchesella dallaii]|uniref:Protein cornichon n=1 Tax=Orchesella dallaii TaxID=48710 RepID=A0ABP1PYP5_9HEXA